MIEKFQKVNDLFDHYTHKMKDYSIDYPELGDNVCYRHTEVYPKPKTLIYRSCVVVSLHPLMVQDVASGSCYRVLLSELTPNITIL